MAAPTKGYATIANLAAASKPNPGAIKFGSVGVGPCLADSCRTFRCAGWVNVVRIPYSGAAEVLADLTAGRIDFYFVPVTPAPLGKEALIA
jgi:tripartite-type tricarboxylate transporter receptor subunit TctC